jgi:hypothetical protein
MGLGGGLVMPRSRVCFRVKAEVTAATGGPAVAQRGSQDVDEVRLEIDRILANSDPARS